MSTPGAELRTGEDRATLHLPELLGVADGPQLHTTCLEAVETGLPVTVDASKVQRIHSAALQCLIALAIHLREHGAGIEWTGGSAELNRQIETLGLMPWIGLGKEARG